jgi:hypothetical protein
MGVQALKFHKLRKPLCNQNTWNGDTLAYVCWWQWTKPENGSQLPSHWIYYHISLYGQRLSLIGAVTYQYCHYQGFGHKSQPKCFERALTLLFNNCLQNWYETLEPLGQHIDEWSERASVSGLRNLNERPHYWYKPVGYEVQEYHGATICTHIFPNLPTRLNVSGLQSQHVYN